MAERAKSFWGWGYEDKLPDEATRRGLGEQLSAMLGFPASSPRPLPRFEEVRLPEPSVVPPADLRASTAARDRITHTYGRSYPDLVRGFSGDFGCAPDAVFFPCDEADVVRQLAWCAAKKVAAVPFGGGTSVVRGVEPVRAPGQRGVVSLDLRALDRVLEVDPVSRAARIQAGASGPRIEEQLGEHGLTLRHYPQSFELSTLGGWIATRAGGHFATLYTHIDDLVESVRMVTPTGLFESRRVPASGAGPSPNHWVLGSEGTLGVITEAWMRVQARPRWRASASARFARFEDGVRAARAVAQAGLYPSNCRLLDAREAQLYGVADGTAAVLLLGFESADHALGPWIDRSLVLAVAEGGRVESAPVLREGAGEGRDGDASSWRRAFFDAPYLQSALVTLGVVVDTFETACTWEKFDALHAAVKSAVRAAMGQACGGGILTCRFTHVYPDGPAPYYTFLAPGAPGEEIARWTVIKRAACEALSAEGATITHHHAVGRLHRPWYDRERPEPFARALKAAKREVDPEGILNPGVLIDP